jgi:predicted Zn-dependent peptidase
MTTSDAMPRITSLDSGLRVITDPMASVETISLGVWVGVGTRNEAAEINGCAHLLEHMAFKGTERRSARAIVEEIEAVGGHLNAYTSRENTAFYAKILKQDMALAVDILADIVQHPTLDQEELERERGVVLQEIGQAVDTPDDIIFDHFQETAYPDQGLGRPVLGSAESVRRLSRERLADYRYSNYAGGRLVLTAAGRIDHDELVDLAGTAFRGMHQAVPHGAEPARYEGGEYREHRALEQLHLVLGFPGIGYHDPDFYAESVLSTILGGGMSSRLFQEVREKRGLAYSIYSFASFYDDSGLFGVYAGTGGDDAEELVPVLCDELLQAADRLARKRSSAPRPSCAPAC